MNSISNLPTTKNDDNSSNQEVILVLTEPNKAYDIE